MRVSKNTLYTFCMVALVDCNCWNLSFIYATKKALLLDLFVTKILLILQWLILKAITGVKRTVYLATHPWASLTREIIQCQSQNLYWVDLVCSFCLKPDPHIPQFSENSRKHWARMGKQIICGSLYLYILAIHYCLPNTQILANVFVKNQFSSLLSNLCENAPEYRRIFGIRLFSVFSKNWCMCGSVLTIFVHLASLVRMFLTITSKNRKFCFGYQFSFPLPWWVWIGVYLKYAR